MHLTFLHSHKHSYEGEKAKLSVWKKFILWADSQEQYKVGWMFFSILSHTCFFTMFTAMAVLITGNHFIFWPILIGTIMAVLVVNLAGLSTRITLPVLCLSLLIDATIIVICLLNGFDIAATFR